MISRLTPRPSGCSFYAPDDITAYAAHPPGAPSMAPDDITTYTAPSGRCTGEPRPTDGIPAPVRRQFAESCYLSLASMLSGF